MPETPVEVAQIAAVQISLHEAGALLMISAERIRQLSKAGYIPIPKRGYTTIAGAVQGYIRFLKDEERKGTKVEAQSKAQEMRAREIELRIAQTERTLIPIDDAMLAIDLLAGTVNEEMDGIAARITRDMNLRRTIDADVHGAKKRIAEALAKSAGLARTGVDASEADAED
ncbi:hypothetical protein ACTTAI_14270 [Rhodobacter capsulatus]|uniref:hypothetical protein n=1 Tax=Rhodobacter capsulatus TaxID=1061 RepID=UPI004027B97A